MKISIRLQGETVVWIDDDCNDDDGREALLDWLQSQFYDRCVRDIHIDIKYSGPMHRQSTLRPTDERNN